MKFKTSISLTSVMPLLILNGCSKEEPHPKIDNANVLIATLDTTRADHLGCYGCAQAQTPTLDALASRGALFEDAHTAVPLTLPSHATMMTGRFPREHGIRDNGKDKLGQSLPTLAAIFRGKGYKTGAFVSSFILDHRFGLNRGFDVYDDDVVAEPGGSSQEAERPADAVTERALKWLDANANSPFFCWIHYYDPHEPYAPPQKFRERLPNPYDGEIAFVDSEFARVVKLLESRGQLARTLIVVAGDHGESFGEHGELGHTTFLYESNLHVPLLFACPNAVKACRVKGMVSLVDVFPTILDLFGISKPDGLLGQSLTAALAGGTPATRSGYAESEYAYNAYGWAQQRAFMNDAWKFVSSAKPELFDRKLDRNESHNLASERSDVVKSMQAELGKLYVRMTPNATGKIAQSQDALKRLESLGYASGGSKTMSDDVLTQGVPDPKDMADLMRELQDEHRLFEEKHFAEAAAILERAVQRSPNSLEILLRLGRTYLKINREREAIVALKKALQLDTSNSKTLRALGAAYMQVRQYPDAIQYYELLLEQSPDEPFILDRLGSALAETGKVDQAIARLQKALELKPTDTEFMVHLAGALIAKGAFDDAEGLLKKAGANPKTGPQAHFLLARSAAERDKKELAIQHLEIAVGQSPGYEQAADLLVKYYLLDGRTSDAVRILRNTLRQSPGNVPLSLSLAEILATSKHDEVRNGAEAVSIVEPLLARTQGSRGFTVLAEAKAETGDFESAVTIAEKALATEKSAGNEKLVSFIELQLVSYQAKQAYRSSKF